MALARLTSPMTLDTVVLLLKGQPREELLDLIRLRDLIRKFAWEQPLSCCEECAAESEAPGDRAAWAEATTTPDGAHAACDCQEGE